jgi:hypothetical protein
MHLEASSIGYMANGEDDGSLLAFKRTGCVHG